MTTIKIAYHRADALFVMEVTTEHDGLHHYHCTFHTAVEDLSSHVHSRNTARRVCADLMDGLINVITMEMP